jgi:DNA-directed RNA polymerase subunit beta
MDRVRNFQKVGDAAPIPNLIDIQTASYARFLQADADPARRRKEGLEALLREIFPIVSYDEQATLEYLYYELGEPRYTPQECRDLKLTYGMPFRVRCRLARKDSKDVLEESIYLGEIPIMMGGGEFIINGAERVIVSQLHRSPGVDFTVEMQESDRPLHGARIIPERGSWIEMEVTKKDIIAIRIDQSSKIPATTFLRALDANYGTDAAIIREFHPTRKLATTDLRPTMYVVEAVVDPESGEELVPAGGQIGDALTRIISTPITRSGVTVKDAQTLIAHRMEHKVFPVEFKEDLGRLRRRLVDALGPKHGHENTKDDRQAILECIEDRVMVEFGPSDNLKASCAHLPRFNYEGPEHPQTLTLKKKWSEFESDLAPVKQVFDDIISGVKSPEGWSNSSKKPGLYVFRDNKDGKIVYVGIGWRRGVSDEISTQRTSDAEGSSLVKQVLEWMRKTGEGVKSGGRACQIEVVDKAADPLILNTLAEDPADTHENALLRIYARLRPGNPPQVDKARTLFKEKFFDDNRYRLGKVGRFRINRKFGQDIDEKAMTLRVEDFVNTLKYLLRLRNGEGTVDDIDHLGNRRLRTIDELGAEELRKGFLKLRRTVQERMSLKDPGEMTKISELVNSKSISSSIDYFFGRGELSQVVDQQNPLSQLTHERRLSALGPGGLNRKRAGFEVRDVHISHYGRICPIETPEGSNIGLISSLGIYAGVDEYGFLTTPYRAVKNGKVTDEVVHLRADEEMEAVLAPPDSLVPNRSGEYVLPENQPVLVRAKGELNMLPGHEVEYVDISPKQTVGVSAALIPFLEHDDANRALMGSNMQRQAVPLLRAEPPIVATGVERAVAENSSMVVRARKGGTVTYVDAQRVIVDNADEYELRKFAPLNERSVLNQRPMVRVGQRVKRGEVIADGSGTRHGELSLGYNVLVAFMPYDGYNFEDAIVISERLLKSDVFTSVHQEEYEVEIRETKLGREEFTRDIPNVSEKALRNLDANGVVRVGTRVGPGDILVGKVSPKSKSELTPEEKLLHAIFGRAGEDVKNDSLELDPGEEGVVVETRRFSRRTHMSDEQKKELAREMKAYRDQMNGRTVKIFRQMVEEINEVVGTAMVDPSTRQKVSQSDIDAVILEQIETFTLKWAKTSNAAARQQAEEIYGRYWPRIEEIRKEMDRKLDQMKRGDELPSGVLEMVKVRVATKRKLGVGDKMAGRHGNKGVIARIVAEEDMPFLADGTPAEIVLNPLGVPGRMNLGQILETHLGWAAMVLGFQAITPVFDGATEEEIAACLKEANEKIRQRREDREVIQQAGASHELLVEMPEDGKVRVFDGRTGEAFEQKVTVGFLYMNKLHHLVDEKIHARSTGPYSLITQQPLGGKARTGGQRFGEMEVWGLEAYGASYTLQELLTVKSDDVEGRTKIYESMVKGTNTLEAGTPVSFDVLCYELRGLGLNIQLEKKKLL